MKYTALILSGLSLASFANAVPAKRDNGPTDIQVLNFALTLEHLEYNFYKQGLQKYSQKDFEDAGFPSWARPRFEQTMAHEEEHVKFLSGALGDNAVKACEYNFPHTDPKSFAALSNTLENVGVSAYSGAAKYIHNKVYLTAAASILSVEARHTAWLDSSVRKASAWGGPFDIPLDVNHVYTIASGLITSCPSSNQALPVHAFPALNAVVDSQAKSVTLSFNAAHDGPLYAVFITGSGPVSSRINHNGGKYTAAIPEGLQGYNYLIVSGDATSVADEHTIAGPAVLEFRYNSVGTML